MSSFYRGLGIELKSSCLCSKHYFLLGSLASTNACAHIELSRQYFFVWEQSCTENWFVLSFEHLEFVQLKVKKMKFLSLCVCVCVCCVHRRLWLRMPMFAHTETRTVGQVPSSSFCWIALGQDRSEPEAWRFLAWLARELFGFTSLPSKAEIRFTGSCEFELRSSACIESTLTDWAASSFLPW